MYRAQFKRDVHVFLSFSYRIPSCSADFFFLFSFLIPGVVFTTTTSFPFSYINSYREYTAADAQLEKVNTGPPLPCPAPRPDGIDDNSLSS